MSTGCHLSQGAPKPLHTCICGASAGVDSLALVIAIGVNEAGEPEVPGFSMDASTHSVGASKTVRKSYEP